MWILSRWLRKWTAWSHSSFNTLRRSSNTLEWRILHKDLHHLALRPLQLHLHLEELLTLCVCRWILPPIPPLLLVPLLLVRLDLALLRWLSLRVTVARNILLLLNPLVLSQRVDLLRRIVCLHLFLKCLLLLFRLDKLLLQRLVMVLPHLVRCLRLLALAMWPTLLPFLRVIFPTPRPLIPFQPFLLTWRTLLCGKLLILPSRQPPLDLLSRNCKIYWLVRHYSSLHLVNYNSQSQYIITVKQKHCKHLFKS